ncbi:hypothetical protein CYMTET_6020 [Cymbomonas tetramitiformis]|uniref:Uncharacterized protein n=1 Tax=Cymbomonas tetramitiformis TaxID=36881 RepID=A0AAE0GY93_9CHLO|nr:hypothetical protein CYMTET_6020 [Cymbomonas tetramitiformis]
MHSTWDVDVVKRGAKNSLGSKDSKFSGSEKNRNVLCSSMLKTAQQAFEAKESNNDVLFDLADATKETNPIFNGIIFSTLTSLTAPHSPARRCVGGA